MLNVAISAFLLSAIATSAAGFISTSAILRSTSIIASPTPPESRNPARANCDCAELQVSAGYTGVRRGDEIEFYADFSDSQIKIPRFEWTVTNGRIVSGQGTEEIVVKTDAEGKGDAVTATVEIPVYRQICECSTRASASVKFTRYSFIEDENAFA